MNPIRTALAALLLAGALPLLCGCWIILPQETALLVEVIDEQGNLVPNFLVSIDGITAITSASGDRLGQVFRSYNGAGLHGVMFGDGGGVDPQGGAPWVVRSTLVSGQTEPVPEARRAPGPLFVEVAKGSVTKITIFLADLLVSPRDNQWLTGGLDATPLRAVNDTREFAAGPLPTFWWRDAPASMGTHPATPDHFTFTLWEDADRDIRYPLGIASANGYLTTLAGIKPDWQIPWAGIQRVRATVDDTGRAFLWAAQAQDAVSAVSYRVRYLQSPAGGGVSYRGEVIHVPAGNTTVDGKALLIEVGPGSANPTITSFGGRAVAATQSLVSAARKAVFKAGVPYAFMLEAVDERGNVSGGETRTATMGGDSNVTIAWTQAASVFVTSDRAAGGAIRVYVPAATATPSTVALTYRIYIAPASDWYSSPFGEEYWRTNVSADAYTTIHGLVNGVHYVVGAEPIDDAGDRPAVGGTTRLVMVALDDDGVADTVAPTVTRAVIGVRGTGTKGEVELLFDRAVDAAASAITYRVYHQDHTVYEPEALESIDFSEAPAYVGSFDSRLRIGGLSTGAHSFRLAAFDLRGNRTLYQSATVTLAGPGSDTAPPVWASEDPSLLFTSVSWSVAGSPASVRRLGWKYDYDGFALRRWPRSDGTGGEYVWRIENGPLASKLAAFYAYSSYYFRSGDPTDVAAPLQMPGLSANVRHKDVLGFLWRRLGVFKSGNESAPAATVGVMNAFIASSFAVPSQYRQRSAEGFLDALAGRSRASSVNQMSIFYPTNGDGKVVSSGSATTGGISTFLDVVLSNRAADMSALFGPQYFTEPNPAFPPALASKRFRLLYNYNSSLLGAGDRLVIDPLRPSTAGLGFDGLLATPDVSPEGFPWQDPAW